MDIPVLPVGELVWACLKGEKMWPGVIIENTDHQKKNWRSKTWIFWFGDYRSSLVPNKNIVLFGPNFPIKYKAVDKDSYRTGVIEAITECALRSKFTEFGDNSALLNWAQNGFQPLTTEQKLFSPDPANPLPQIVNFPAVKRGKVESVTMKLEIASVAEDAVHRVLSGQSDINDICIACNRPLATVECPHPLFEGGLCTDCKNDLLATMFVCDDSGANDYCAVCGFGGEAVVCGNIDKCCRVYCKDCVTALVGPEGFLNAQRQEPWHCFLCSDKKQGILQVRPDWRQRLLKFYPPLAKVSAEETAMNRPIRVLSLFDGALAGKVALDSLGIAVEKFYNAEVTDEKTETYGVIQLCNVKSLTEVQISRICPIDLLIGGMPPSNEVPIKKGLYDTTGTGFLFFEYYRILEAVVKFNNDRPLLWLFENVTAIPREFKVMIDRFLKCEPVLVDMQDMRLRQSRYFWGNIPELYGLLPKEIQDKSTELESAVAINCEPVNWPMNKVPTEKVRRFLKKDGEVHFETVDENIDCLAVELKKFNYKNVEEIVVTRGKMLMARVWVIPVLEYFFAPLKDCCSSGNEIGDLSTNTSEAGPSNVKIQRKRRPRYQ